ncbi:protein that affects bud emergence, intrachromosomal recombination, and nuclear division [Scheffersomyces xylosifermentans]|uniref:protein that affects bud emergence, intrachromosomal recombination, and nuclear division n=1 Tax=Scheffersomyces xylosifermentans TaxID=1304137 RepID=UPI00315D7C0D
MFRILMPKLRSIHHLSLLIVLAWILTFLIHERVVPYYTVSRCSWPTMSSSVKSAKQIQQDDKDDALLKTDQDQDERSSHQVTNILLIADPQLIDNHTYPGRNELLLQLSKHTVDTYLKRNYNNLITQLRPDYVFFLGDYLDNARDSSRKYYKKELKRFDNIFYNKLTEATYTRGTNWFVNVPGNHDIGLGDMVNLKARKRFNKYFGQTNTVTTINNVDFISIDALSLSASDKSINEDVTTFIDKNFGETIVKTKPRVLLSHIPLYRDPSLSCGPLRESSVFDVMGAGYQYKSTIEESISDDLLTKIKPDLIFSGDDHDYCDIIHESTNSREITVKSISMAMGIKYPAVQMLSFTNSDNEDDYQVNNQFKFETKICYTQIPYVNVANYIVLAVASGVVLLMWNIKSRSSRHHYTSILPLVDVIGDGTEMANNSSKIKDFLREHDENDLSGPVGLSSDDAFPLASVKAINIPKYTFTSSSRHTVLEYIGSTKVGSLYRECMTFMKKWNLFAFLKHSLVLSVLIIVLYYVGFCMTL